ncbi:MAG: tRNA lysidine(34) synthetase TilS [Clostridia bacterium]|nr:tRNA lysidine(34) synthetase TilS [Clostridia bacterium]
MKNKVKQTIEKYNLINEEDKILVAVSGGPDSISLLNVLHDLGYNLCVAHVNHGLRENAKKDEEFVKNFCEERNIPCFIKKINLKELMESDIALKGMSTEEAGRKARYDFFNEVLRKQNCNKIATAHNSNDNVETVIMNMVRGSGLSGLKGIDASRDNIIRPLIETSRKEIEEYCKENNLNPRHDESNDETVYTRNKVRLELIPYIEKNINSNVVNNITRMSKIISEEERFILDLVEQSYNEIVLKESETEIICSLKLFNNLDVVLKRRLILKMIIKVLGNAKDIEKVHVDDIVKLCQNNVGGKFLTPNKNIKISVLRGKVKFEKAFN